MKFLKDLLEFRAVPATGPDASRPTPVSNLAHWGKSNAPLPDEFCQDRTWCEEEDEEDVGTDHLITDIEQETMANDAFRNVLYTTRDMQLVLMSLEPGEDIGEEVHENIDQFIRVEGGEGKVVLNGKEIRISDGTAFIIPQGTKHNIINTSRDDLKLYTIYTPPNHQKDVIHQTKKDVEEEHFDGDTDVT